MRTYRQKAEDAQRIGRGVTVSPAWLLAALDAMEPVAALWRTGDEDSDEDEIILRRGVASDADYLTSRQLREIGAIFRQAMTPKP